MRVSAVDTAMTALNISIPTEGLAEFCRRWKITELSLFGSALREDFGPESDVDVLVKFEQGAAWDFDHWDQMTVELESIFDRPVDLVEQRWIRNPFMRHSILTSRRVVYAA